MHQSHRFQRWLAHGSPPELMQFTVNRMTCHSAASLTSPSALFLLRNVFFSTSSTPVIPAYEPLLQQPGVLGWPENVAVDRSPVSDAHHFRSESPQKPSPRPIVLVVQEISFLACTHSCKASWQTTSGASVILTSCKPLYHRAGRAEECIRG
jgi:hypothetical protein